ncbi:DNA translocase FtsK 4TM domain-containing protein [Helicobacter bilis]|uniref:DNA translocase FtsK 4TM domain-containing protein n=1 Tax=Helicobacter bilis TaxID=37372 RepID=UPI00255819D7|nr:DNA translocase FtsK 4TM domain-containing protein [Helicobacter bilis]
MQQGFIIKKIYIFVFISCCVLYLWLATIFGYTPPDAALSGAAVSNSFFKIGGFGNSFANFNRGMFGYLAYIYLPLLLLPIYRFHDDTSYSFRKIQLSFAYLLLFIGLLLLQSLVFHSGQFGNYLQEVLTPYIGLFGVAILTFICISTALLLIAERTATFILGYLGGSLQMAYSATSNFAKRAFQQLKSKYTDFKLDSIQREKRKIVNQELSEKATTTKSKYIDREPLLETALDEYPRTNTNNGYTDTNMQNLARNENLAHNKDMQSSNTQTTNKQEAPQDSKEFSIQVKPSNNINTTQTLSYQQYDDSNISPITHTPRTQMKNNDEELLRRFQKANLYPKQKDQQTFHTDSPMTFRLKQEMGEANPLESFAKTQQPKILPTIDDWQTTDMPPREVKTTNLIKPKAQEREQPKTETFSVKEGITTQDNATPTTPKILETFKEDSTAQIQPKTITQESPTIRIKESEIKDSTNTHLNTPKLEINPNQQHTEQKKTIKIQAINTPKIEQMPTQANYKTLDMSFTQKEYKTTNPSINESTTTLNQPNSTDFNQTTQETTNLNQTQITESHLNVAQTLESQHIDYTPQQYDLNTQTLQQNALDSQPSELVLQQDILKTNNLQDSPFITPLESTQNNIDYTETTTIIIPPLLDSNEDSRNDFREEFRGDFNTQDLIIQDSISKDSSINNSQDSTIIESIPQESTHSPDSTESNHTLQDDIREEIKEIFIEPLESLEAHAQSLSQSSQIDSKQTDSISTESHISNLNQIESSHTDSIDSLKTNSSIESKQAESIPQDSILIETTQIESNIQTQHTQDFEIKEITQENTEYVENIESSITNSNLTKELKNKNYLQQSTIQDLEQHHTDSKITQEITPTQQNITINTYTPQMTHSHFPTHTNPTNYFTGMPTHSQVQPMNYIFDSTTHAQTGTIESNLAQPNNTQSNEIENNTTQHNLAQSNNIESTHTNPTTQPIKIKLYDDTQTSRTITHKDIIQNNISTQTKDLTHSFTIKDSSPHIESKTTQITESNDNENREDMIIRQIAQKKEEARQENSILIANHDTNIAHLAQSTNLPPFILPPLKLLQEPIAQDSIQDIELDSKIDKMLQIFNAHKIRGDIIATLTGPVVTTFEFRPETHVKVSKILSHKNDLARILKAKSIRIQAPIPGKDVIGIQIPNSKVETIYLREILHSQAFLDSKDPLTIALGKDISGTPIVANLAKLPHLLVAGTTGSGKSVGVNAIILSLLYRNDPDNLKLMMIDPKQVEFAPYEDLPHLITPIINAPNKAIKALQVATIEMDKRYELFSQIKVKNIASYNEKVSIKMPNFVIIIDELADLMITGGKEAEAFIARIAQMGRAAGMHLIIATQRSSVNVITGHIKANLPSRISYRVGSRIDSKVILDEMGAEDLLGNGDGLFTTTNGLMRIHAPWVSEQEVEHIVDFIKAQREPQYDESFLSETKPGAVSGDKFSGDGSLLDKAKEVMMQDNKTSISYLQRKLGIGYNKSASLVEALEKEGFLSPPNSKGERNILV